MKYKNIQEKCPTKIDMSEILDDRSSTGRKRPWAEKKSRNVELAEVYKKINERKTERLLQCGDFLTFEVDSAGKKRLKSGNFCRVRLCPLCSWRRSLKIFKQMTAIMSAAAPIGMEYLLLTLTVKNCVGSELNEQIKAMMSAFSRFRKRKQVESVAKAWYRALEITYNPKTQEYHPHFHCIIGVNPSYFKDTKVYLSQAKWTEIWQKSMRLNYTPICDVRKIKGDTAKAVAETAKYTVKESDYLLEDKDMTVDVVRTLDEALDSKRLVAYGGIFKELHKKLNLDDAVDGDLVRVGDEEKLSEDEKHEIAFAWSAGLKNYYKIER